MLKDPDKGNKVFHSGKRGNPVAEIPHIERAGAGGGKDGDQKKRNRQRCLPGRDRRWIESTSKLMKSGQAQRTGLLFVIASGIIGCNCGNGGVGEMQFLARLESDRFARTDGDLGPGSRIPANARLARPYVEDAKTAQLDPVAGGKRFLQTLKDGIDCGFRLIAGQSGPLDHIVDDVLLDQRAHLGKSAGLSLHPKPMLESFYSIVNAQPVP